MLDGSDANWVLIKDATCVCISCHNVHSLGDIKVCRVCHEDTHCPTCGIPNGWVKDLTDCVLNKGEYCKRKPKLRKCVVCSRG